MYKIVLSALLMVFAAMPVIAAEVPKAPAQDWSFEGFNGTYDRAALQRGFQVYRQVCSACHSMDRMAYRNLADLGYSEDQIKSIAAEATIAEINDEGEFVERPRRPSDYFKNPYPNKQAARYANNGALPPDLSLIAAARTGGADYIYALLTGYTKMPSGMTMSNGMNYNKYFPGHQIAMAAPLSDGLVAYADANTPTTVPQYARDVSTFLAWASDPHLEERNRTGIKVIIFLAVLAGIMYFVKKRLWARIKGH